MIGSSLVHYLLAMGISKSASAKKPLLALDVILSLVVLGLFKYTGMIVTTINQIAHSNIPVPAIVMPIGISFFTFQSMSYVIDVYRERVEVQTNFLKVLLYISFFPQLIAGPIVKYRDISKEIDERHADAQQVMQGLQRFIIGLSKKVLISNTVGQVFGFHFRENFDHPYDATCIRDFWRKWHISLSSWFKDYVYIPLGGNRKGKVRTAINKLIVFFLTGLWHGANWTFVVWGLFHGCFLMLEEFVPKLQKLPRVVAHIYSLVVVTVGFVIFRADTLSQGWMFIRKMFSDFSMSAAGNSLAMQQMTPWFIFILVIAVLCAAPVNSLVKGIRSKMTEGSKGLAVCGTIKSVFTLVLLLWCMIRLSGNAYNPFIYFRF